VNRNKVKDEFYQTPVRQYQRIQIFTIEQFLDGKQPHIPFLDPSGFKAARQPQGNSSV